MNVWAPIALAQLALPVLRERGGAIVNITSDAATGPYATWGPYGSTKAALDQLSNVLAAEESAVAVWALDPGEMADRDARGRGGRGRRGRGGSAREGRRGDRTRSSGARWCRCDRAAPDSGRYTARDFDKLHRHTEETRA